MQASEEFFSQYARTFIRDFLKKCFMYTIIYTCGMNMAMCQYEHLQSNICMQRSRVIDRLNEHVSFIFGILISILITLFELSLYHQADT